MNNKKTTSKKTARKSVKSVKSNKASSKAPKKVAPKRKQAVAKKTVKKAKAKVTKEQKLVNVMRKFDREQQVGISNSIHNVIENAKKAAAAFKAGKFGRTWSLLDGILAHVDEALVAIESKDANSLQEQEDRKFLMGFDGYEHPAPSSVIDDKVS